MDPRENHLNRADNRDPEAERIRREIERTRCRMDETVDEIQMRLSPRYIANQAVCSIKKKANDMIRSLVDIFRDNPIPTAVIGAGAAWLATCALRNRRHRGHATAEDARLRRETAAYQQGLTFGKDPPLTPSSPRLGGVPLRGGLSSCHTIEEDTVVAEPETGRISRAVGAVREGASTIGHRVSDAASSVGHRMSHAATAVGHGVTGAVSSVGHRVSDGAHYVASGTRHSAAYASRQARDTFTHHPLVVLLGAAGLGLAAGLAIPATRREDEWMGATRDDLMRKARDAGAETLERGTDMAKKAVARAAGEAALTSVAAASAKPSRAASRNEAKDRKSVV